LTSSKIATTKFQKSTLKLKRLKNYAKFALLKSTAGGHKITNCGNNKATEFSSQLQRTLKKKYNRLEFKLFTVIIKVVRTHMCVFVQNKIKHSLPIAQLTFH
jgi:hypothetical protein